MSPTISVVIPVRDDAAELHECLRHLAQQHLRPHEVIVVDNGSLDDSAAVARAAGARVIAEPRPGIPFAAAAGYDASRGDVIARLDADSRPRPGWTAAVSARLSDPEVDALTGWGLFRDLPPLLGWPATITYLAAYYAMTGAAIGALPLWGSSMAIRRTAWEQARSQVHLTEDVHDDMDLAFVLGPRPESPATTVKFEPRMRADVSARSLRPGPQWNLRLRRAGTTLRTHWDSAPPWQRWGARGES